MKFQVSQSALVTLEDEDVLAASRYSPPQLPLWSLGSEMEFAKVDTELARNWHVIDELCTKHLACIWRRISLLKTVRHLFTSSIDESTLDSPEAMTAYDEMRMRKTFLDNIDMSIVGLPVRVLDVIHRNFLILTAHWVELNVPAEVKLSLDARATRLERICEQFYFIQLNCEFFIYLGNN